MVTRKPLPPNASIDPALTSPTRMQAARQQSDPENVWGSESRQQEQRHRDDFTGASEEVPPALRPGSSTSYVNIGEEDNVWADPGPRIVEGGGVNSEVTRVPTVLRPGGSGLKTDEPVAETGTDAKDINRVPTVLRPGGGRAETNPFKRMKSAEEDELALSTSTPPVPSVPTGAFSQLSVSESSNNPWQPALEEKAEAPTGAPLVTGASDQDIGTDVWGFSGSARPTPRATRSNSSALLPLPSDRGSAGWEEEESQKAPTGPPPIPPPTEEVLEEAHAWDGLGNVDKGKGPARPPQIPTTQSAGPGEDWDLIDVEAPPGPPPKKDAWGKLVDIDEDSQEEPSAPAAKPEDQPPALPPRKSTEEQAPAPPPRPVDKSETYQIKNINWHDVNSAKNPRTSPILVQNANGPCPLVALVNALSLTTPADRPNTVLVETLRSREQISLEFLLNAVFDELMSGGRTSVDVALPDVTELYNFLKGLHTGMNVNPRFVPTPEVVNAFKRTSLTHLHPTERGDLIPGTFEDTKEMALYATFGIPLIHGWLPSRDDAVYDAFTRQAVSYEDIQNLLFREEELEDKLSSADQEGLTEEEQQIYQDILTIKSFLSISATQLTNWGLEVIRQSMKPGSVAILFRNDHFTTLYKHPQTQELLTLVTDAGYASHAEVVWESLVDINGERAEFFSGDFRLVGGASHSEQRHQRSSSCQESSSRASNSNEWHTVQGRRGGHGRSQSSAQAQSDPDDAPLSPTHEQEDRDLALALQLQEEEDERHRAEQERRRRESALSMQYIEQQGHIGSGPNAARGGRGGGVTPTTARRGGSVASGRGGSQTSLASSGQSAPNRLSSNGVNIPVTQSTGTPTGMRRPAAQTVRSLIPPRAPAVSRPADEGLDDAPPSYEQAAKQTPYVPPAGHPSHPASAPGTADGPATPVGTGATANVAGPSNVSRPMRNPMTPGPGPGPGPGRYRPGIPPAQVAGNGGTRDRDCIVM